MGYIIYTGAGIVGIVVCICLSVCCTAMCRAGKEVVAEENSKGTGLAQNQATSVKQMEEGTGQTPMTPYPPPSTEIPSQIPATYQPNK